MYDKNLWEGILSSLEKTVDPKLVNTWLGSAKISTTMGDNIIVKVPNKFYKNWVDRHYLGKITAILKEEFGIESPVKVVFDDVVKPVEVVQEKQDAPIKDNFTSLDAKLTFDNFVAGETNGFAHNAAQTVADGNFNIYNPLYIYGGTGLGKTHLMYAVANRVRAKFPKMNILYMDSETFSTEIVNLFRKGEKDMLQDRVESMRKRFRSVDLFMLDDIQFLKERPKTLEFFFNIFNDLQLYQKQIVITSDESPQKIDMAERMRSRFASGFQAEIQPPTTEERVAILMQKSEELNIPLEETLAFFLAENVNTSNVRELIGALKRVSLYASFHSTNMSIELAEKALMDSKQLKKADAVATPQQLITAISELYNVKLSDLVSKKRTQSIVHPRQVAMYLMKEKLSLSLKEIGNHFGGRDHSTVKYAVDSIKFQLKTDEHLAEIINKVINKAFN